MRDYAELITRLKQSDDNCNAECCECSGECLSSGCNIFSEAADAIEELLRKMGAKDSAIEFGLKRIENLQAENEELLAKVPTWISVEELLAERTAFWIVPKETAIADMLPPLQIGEDADDLIEQVERFQEYVKGGAE